MKISETLEVLQAALAECEKEKTALNRIAGDMEEKLAECEKDRDTWRQKAIELGGGS